MNAFALCGAALLAFAAIEVVGRQDARLAVFIGSVGILCLIAPGILSLSGLLEPVKEGLEKFNFYGGDLLLRSFGIGLCCEVTGEILRDAGRQGLANALDLSCKIAVLLLCVPLWKQIFSLVGEFLE